MTCAAVLQTSGIVEVLPIAVNGTIIPITTDDTQAIMPNPSWNGERDIGFLVRLISAVKTPITLEDHTAKSIPAAEIASKMHLAVEDFCVD